MAYRWIGIRQPPKGTITLYLEILNRDAVFPVSFAKLEDRMVVLPESHEEVWVNIITRADALILLANRKLKSPRDYRIWEIHGNKSIRQWNHEALKEMRKTERVRKMRERALAIGVRQRKQNSERKAGGSSSGEGGKAPR